MVKELDLNLERRTKPIAYRKDAALILRCLFEPASLCSFGTVRSVLYLTLFITLAIDSCGRIGEIIPPDPQRQAECLHWSDIEFHIRRRKDAVDFTANVTFKWLKGMRTKPSEYKTVSIRLLPQRFAFEDTLRLIINLALVEGHFEDVESWKDFDRLQIGPELKVLRLKQSSLALPVLLGVSMDGIVSNNPLAGNLICKWLIRLGQRTGFTEGLTRLMAPCFSSRLIDLTH